MIGIAQPTVQNILNQGQLLTSQLFAQNGLHGLLQMPNGNKDDLNLFLKQFQQPPGNGAGTLNSTPGSVLYSSQKTQ